MPRVNQDTWCVFSHGWQQQQGGSQALKEGRRTCQPCLHRCMLQRQCPSGTSNNHDENIRVLNASNDTHQSSMGLCHVTNLNGNIAKNGLHVPLSEDGSVCTPRVLRTRCHASLTPTTPSASRCVTDRNNAPVNDR